VNIEKLFSKEQYARYVPAVVELNAGSVSPFDILSSLSGDHPYKALLETVSPNARTGRYSLISWFPHALLSAYGDSIELTIGSECYGYTAHPLYELEKLCGLRKRTSDLPFPFIGGGIGYLSYDLNRYFHAYPDRDVVPTGYPDLFFMFVDSYMIFDHILEKVYCVSLYDPLSNENRQGAQRILDEMVSCYQNCLQVKRSTKKEFVQPKTSLDDIGAYSILGKKKYVDMVRRVKEYIRCGDIYQANVSHRIDFPAHSDGVRLYENLRRINPSPFASYLQCGSFEIISCSPERLCKKENNFIETRPIAGTRPRGISGQEDFVMRSDLLLSEKERAEHIMLVDLARNDIGKIALTGNVEVDEFMVVEKYSHVQHIVSNVRGIIQKNIGLVAFLESLFPCGTITGVPKIRCMEIIDELESVKRGIYTGSLGYISDNGDLDLNVAIRTIVKQHDTFSLQVGAGIVADSDPEMEYYESLHKAHALYEALKATEEIVNDECIHN